MVHVPRNTGKGLVQSSRTSDAKPHLPERAQIRWGVYGRTPCPRPVVWFDSTKPDRLRRGDEPVSPASLGPQSGRQGVGVVSDEASPKLAAPSDGRGRTVTSRDHHSLSENFGRKPIPAGASPVSLGRDVAAQVDQGRFPRRVMDRTARAGDTNAGGVGLDA